MSSPWKTSQFLQSNQTIFFLHIPFVHSFEKMLYAVEMENDTEYFPAL